MNNLLPPRTVHKPSLTFLMKGSRQQVRAALYDRAFFMLQFNKLTREQKKAQAREMAEKAWKEIVTLKQGDKPAADRLVEIGKGWLL